MKITKNNLWPYTIFAVLWCAVTAYAISAIPYCSLSRIEEYALTGASIVLTLMVIAPNRYFVYAHSIGDTRTKYIALTLFLFICSLPVFSGAMGRHHDIGIQFWEFDGSVTKKYLSNNHSAKALTIDNSIYEYMPNDLWNLVKVGDSISKHSCGNTVLINGNSVKFKD